MSHRQPELSAETLWLRLSERAKADLSAKGFDERGFAARSTRDGLAIVNNYAKLRVYSLWDLVESEVCVSSGCLDFRCADVEALRATLVRSKAFSNPGPLAAWSSRELVRTSSLHFKHFEGWPQDQVQVHVDRHGSKLRGWWWLFPPLVAWQLLLHLQDYESYRDVHATFGRLSPLFERLGVLVE